MTEKHSTPVIPNERLTKGCKKVLEVLERTKELSSAQDIHGQLRAEAMSPPGLTTVYRSLESLVILGLVQAVDLGDGERRYELIEPGEHHHHIICEECRGKGRVNNDKPCGTCKGKGIVTIKKKISVNVPAGIDSGERLTIEGEGDQLIGGESGDLFVDIKIDPDPIYKRKGSNLIRDLCITSRIANNGGRVKTSTPWGDIHVVIPNKSADGQLLRLKGKGVKFGANSSGDLMLRLKIAKNNSFIDKMKSLFARIGI